MALIIPVIEFPGPVGALPITSVVNAGPPGLYWDRTANRGTNDLRVQPAISSLCVGCLIQAWFFLFLPVTTRFFKGCLFLCDNNVSRMNVLKTLLITSHI